MMGGGGSEMSILNNSRVLPIISLLVAVCLLASPANAQYGGGTGEPNDPYQITTAEDLMLLGASPDDYDKHFILTADIDLDPNLPGRKVFTRAVIAPDQDDGRWWFSGASFNGVFDGNGHTISHLMIEGASYLGLFGWLESEAMISNLGLEAVNITGSSDYIGGLAGYNFVGSIATSSSTGTVRGNEGVGGLVGYNRGSITQCSSAGTITGSGDYIGGLAGGNWSGSITRCSSTSEVHGNDNVGGLVGSNSSGSITQSSSTGTVNGNENVGGLTGYHNSGSITTSSSTGTVDGASGIGGLVGRNDDSITTCYSTGAVGGESRVGGLVGRNGGRIATSYSIGTVRGEETIGGGLVGWNRGSISTSFWDIETSGLAGSDGGVGLTTGEMMDPYMLGLNGFANDPNWILDAGHDYPRLVWEGTAGQKIEEPDIDWMEGHGTEQNPYRIDTADQLVLLGKASILWDKQFVLGANIDMDPNLPDGQIFKQAIIPTFTGVCDGNDHVIDNLVIEGGPHLGLFGQLQNGAVVKNLGIVDANITGLRSGALVGSNRVGRITNCYSTGMISGAHVGGLVGSNGGDVAASYSTGTISGEDYIGGLAGSNGGSITTSYSTGSVSGANEVGGLVGRHWSGSITQSSSTATVDGNEEVGGLVGSSYGNISTSYSSGTVSGNEKVGGLVGSNGGNIAATYSTGGVDGQWGVGGLVGYNNSGSIVTSYSTGRINGPDSVGGLVGYGDVSNFWRTDCFWDKETSGQETSAWGTGKTTVEMQKAGTFLEAGWDFVDETQNGTDDIWWILEGRDYPRLWWDLIPEN